MTSHSPMFPPCFLRWYRKQWVDVATPWGLHIYDAHQRSGGVLTQTWCAWQRLQTDIRGAHREDRREGKWVCDEFECTFKNYITQVRYEHGKVSLIWFMHHSKCCIWHIRDIFCFQFTCRIPLCENSCLSGSGGPFKHQFSQNWKFWRYRLIDTLLKS